MFQLEQFKTKIYSESKYLRFQSTHLQPSFYFSSPLLFHTIPTVTKFLPILIKLHYRFRTHEHQIIRSRRTSSIPSNQRHDSSKTDSGNGTFVSPQFCHYVFDIIGIYLDRSDVGSIGCVLASEFRVVGCITVSIGDGGFEFLFNLLFPVA